jgi:signal peptidase I
MPSSCGTGSSETVKEGRRLKRWVLALVLPGLAVILLRYHVFQPYVITGSSMEETLLPGDHLLVERLSYRRARTPRPGEIVVFRGERWRREESRVAEGLLIKRVIAVAGDQVEIRRGTVYVNGEPIVEPATVIGTDARFDGKRKVTKGTVFVMGDNRNDSMDSRFLGGVLMEEIEGRVLLRFWPWNRACLFASLSGRDAGRWGCP